MRKLYENFHIFPFQKTGRVQTYRNKWIVYYGEDFLEKNKQVRVSHYLTDPLCEKTCQKHLKFYPAKFYYKVEFFFKVIW